MKFGKLWGSWSWLEKAYFALAVSLAITGLVLVITVALAIWGGKKLSFSLGDLATVTVDFGSEEEDGDNGEENGEENGEGNGDGLTGGRPGDPDGDNGGQLPFDQALVDLGRIRARRQAFGIDALQEAVNK